MIISKILKITILISLAFYPYIGKTADSEAYFKIFDKVSSTALKLYSLDKAMYNSLDAIKSESKEVLSKVSIYRFCLKDNDSTYHVIYGYPNNNEFVQTCVLQCDSSFTFTKDTNNYTAYDISLLYKIAKQKEYVLTKYANQKIDLSYYFIPNTENIKMYILPSWQRNGLAIYGPDYTFIFDKNGNQIDSIINNKEPLFYNPNTEKEDEIYLDFRENDYPSLGGLFFIMLYKPYFMEIILETKTMKSYLMNLDNFQWGHILKEKN